MIEVYFFLIHGKYMTVCYGKDSGEKLIVYNRAVILYLG
jgi:hypothetical protein